MISYPTGQARSLYDAAFLPRSQMSFREAGGPVTEPVSKFGGQPTWLGEPLWPVHPRTGEPLVFIGQFRIPGHEVRLAYLFLDEDGMVMGSEPETGEAVVLVQPGGRVPSFAVIGPPGTLGRTLWRWGPGDTPIPVEYLVDLLPVPPDEDAEADHQAAFWRSVRGDGPKVEVPANGDSPADFVGGTAVFPNGHAWDLEPSVWRFLCQFEDRGESHLHGDPFFLNFGYGSGFVFVSPDGLEGRFLSDCS